LPTAEAQADTIPMKVAVLDDYQQVALQFADWSRVQASCEVTVFDRNLKTVDEAVAVLAGYDVVCLMRERMPVPAALIELLPSLKLIVVTGAHNRTLDLAAAARQGVVVSATRSAGTEHPTAELTWGLILDAARSISREAQAVREGRWQESVGTTLHGRTLGVVGFGRLGKAVAGIGKAFSMDLLAWSPHLTEERATEGGATLVSKAELFERSDVVTVHMVLSATTRGLIAAEDIARMRPDAILVNTSRGPLIDEAALINALRAGRIRCAALDVYDEEPLPETHPFRTLPNVVATPHLGYVTRETLAVFFNDVVEDIEAFLAGNPIRELTD
jgi:phosphoglycerate dehydrogenase-like enzyme